MASFSCRLCYGVIASKTFANSTTTARDDGPYHQEMEMEREWLEVVLKEDDADKKVVRLSKVSSEPAVALGENFASSIDRVQLAAVLGSGKMARKSLILKRLPQGKNRVDFLEAHSYFQTEIKMYVEVLPALEEVLREQGVPPLWPGFLGLKDNVLIFSDLKSKNYRTQCRKERLDLAHALLAVRTLAIFHAGSAVLKRRGLLDPAQLEPFFYTRDTLTVRRLMSGGVRRLAAVMAAEWGQEWAGISERLERKAETCFEELRDLSVTDEDRLNVLCHGDLWTTNLLFKYSSGVDTPIGVRFVDFQLCHYNSYAFDLTFFVVCTLPPELRKTSGRKILESYAKSLRESLTYHGYPELAPTPAEVEAEMERVKLFRFIFTCCSTPVCLSEVDDAFNFDALFEPGGMAQSPRLYNMKYKNEVQEDLMAWAKQGLF